MDSNYTYHGTLAAAEKASWRIDDIIGGERRLDFGAPFLPESLARVEPLSFLTPGEKLALNQIRGHEYLNVFGLVEEFILPFVLDHARPQLSGDDYRARSLLQFAAEEAKHIHLFKRFRDEFAQGFGTRCDVIGPPQAIAEAVLAHDRLSVALVILQIEWMTQRHYVDSVRNDGELDRQFASLLRHHWMEEAQHAKLDTLMVQEIAASYDEAGLERAVDGYLAIGGLLDSGLQQQVELNLASFERATGRALSSGEQEEYRRVQQAAVRWTYLGSGMTHAKFLGTLERLQPVARTRIEAAAPAFC